MTPGGTSGVPTAPSRSASRPRHSSTVSSVEDRAVAQVAGAAEVVVDRCRGRRRRRARPSAPRRRPRGRSRRRRSLRCREVASHVLPKTEKPPTEVDGRRAHARKPRALLNDDYGVSRCPDIAGQCNPAGCRRVQQVTSGNQEAGSIAPWPTRNICRRPPTTGCSEEFQELTTRGRVDIARKIETARELGDLSENGDYHAAKEEQGKMEGRIRHLEALLKNAEIVEARRLRGRRRRARSSRSATRATTTPSAT